MKTFFLIVFFKIFQFSKFIGNVDDDSYAFKSVGILSLFLSLNFLSIVAYYKCWVLHSNEMQLSKLFEILIVLAIGGAVYLIFYKGGKYKIYFERIIQQSRFKGRIGTWLTVFYIIGSILLLASTIWLECKG